MSRNVFLLSFLFVVFGQSVYAQRSASCYWLLERVPDREDFKIRVLYASGDTDTVGAGDYLPVGCNVVGYRNGSVTHSCLGPGCNTYGLVARHPLCCTGCSDVAVCSACGMSVGDGGVAFVGTVYCAGTCPSCDGAGPPCGQNSQCPGGRHCSGGHCVPNDPCGAGGACPVGSVCQGGNCIPGKECAPDGTCPGGQQCQSGVCQPGGCGAGGPCPAGKQCKDGQCIDNPVCGPNGQCPAGQQCKDGKCQPNDPCGAGAACPAGQQCINGTCTPHKKCTEGCNPGDVCQDGECVKPKCDPAALDHVICCLANPGDPGCVAQCDPVVGGSTYTNCCATNPNDSNCKNPCQPSDPSYPNCCFNDPRNPNYPACSGTCNCGSSNWPNCCLEDPSNPAYPNCNCNQCDCHSPNYPACCLNDPSNPAYPECAPCGDGSCKNCNPCQRLDVIIGLLRGPQGSQPDAGNPTPIKRPDPSVNKPSIAWDNVNTLNLGSVPGSTPWTYYLPIPGRGQVPVTFGALPSQWSVGGHALNADLMGSIDGVRVMMRAVLLLLATWRFGHSTLHLLFRF